MGMGSSAHSPAAEGPVAGRYLENQISTTSGRSVDRRSDLPNIGGNGHANVRQRVGNPARRTVPG
jgi:hypothetical protein